MKNRLKHKLFMGADAFAAPFVYARLRKKRMDFTIQAACANNGRLMEIALDSDLKSPKSTQRRMADQGNR